MSRWTEDEIASLLEMNRDGKSLKEIGKALSRTEGAVKQRLRLVLKSSIARDVNERKAESEAKTKSKGKVKASNESAESNEAEVAKWRRINKTTAKSERKDTGDESKTQPLSDAEKEETRTDEEEADEKAEETADSSSPSWLRMRFSQVKSSVVFVKRSSWQSGRDKVEFQYNVDDGRAYHGFRHKFCGTDEEPVEAQNATLRRELAAKDEQIRNLKAQLNANADSANEDRVASLENENRTYKEMLAQLAALNVRSKQSESK